MRALWAVLVGVVMSLVMVTGVASAAPGQSSWDGDLFTQWDPCTGEYVDQTYRVHFVNTDSIAHFNFHSVGIGETTGASYTGTRAGTEVDHFLSDGTIAVDNTFNIHLVGHGTLSNSYLQGRIHAIFDAFGNLLSGTMNFDSGCRG